MNGQINITQTNRPNRQKHTHTHRHTDRHTHIRPCVCAWSQWPRCGIWWTCQSKIRIKIKEENFHYSNTLVTTNISLKSSLTHHARSPRGATLHRSNSIDSPLFVGGIEKKLWRERQVRQIVLILDAAHERHVTTARLNHPGHRSNPWDLADKSQ